MKTELFKRLIRHAGHDVAIVNYGGGINLSLECNDCGCVIFDTDIYDLTGLEEEKPVKKSPVFTIGELTEDIASDLNEVMHQKFPSYWNEFPEEFLNQVIKDVYETSAWQKHGYYSMDDISIAIQRVTLALAQR